MSEYRAHTPNLNAPLPLFSPKTQQKRASPRGEAGTSGFLCVSAGVLSGGHLITGQSLSWPPCPSQPPDGSHIHSTLGRPRVPPPAAASDPRAACSGPAARSPGPRSRPGACPPRRCARSPPSSGCATPAGAGRAVRAARAGDAARQASHFSGFFCCGTWALGPLGSILTLS